MKELPKIVFPEIDSYVAFLTFADSAAYYIHDSNDNYVAYLRTNGDLEMVLNPSSQGRIFNLKSSGRTFNPKTHLKEAVRYAYLMSQKPID